jgi:large subunit ribosomal protein L3e
MKILRCRQKKAHIMEVQLNCGSVSDKVNFARDQFEKEVLVGAVFA